MLRLGRELDKLVVWGLVGSGRAGEMREQGILVEG